MPPVTRLYSSKLADVLAAEKLSGLQLPKPADTHLQREPLPGTQNSYCSLNAFTLPTVTGHYLSSGIFSSELSTARRTLSRFTCYEYSALRHHDHSTRPALVWDITDVCMTMPILTYKMDILDGFG